MTLEVTTLNLLLEPGLLRRSSESVRRVLERELDVRFLGCYTFGSDADGCRVGFVLSERKRNEGRERRREEEGREKGRREGGEVSEGSEGREIRNGLTKAEMFIVCSISGTTRYLIGRYNKEAKKGQSPANERRKKRREEVSSLDLPSQPRNLRLRALLQRSRHVDPDVSALKLDGCGPPSTENKKGRRVSG